MNLTLFRYQAGGEIRANLIGPRGDVVMVYDSINNLASFTISVTGMTGPVRSARLHGPAFDAATGDLLAGFCVSANCSLANGTPQTFTNVSIPNFANLVGRGLLYINLITDEHTAGEIRGQIMSSVSITGFQATARPRSNLAPSFQSASALLFLNASSPTTITVPMSFGQTGTKCNLELLCDSFSRNWDIFLPSSSKQQCTSSQLQNVAQHQFYFV
jgi:hypothetical protein